jgi:ABC-type Fe3+/spermidine/putrescine transport system ATPase subunit/spermidine/putrescine-binding protein
MITVPGPAQPAAAGDRAAAAPAVHVEGLWKRYGDVTALAGVDLAVRAGEFFTLLGPSGSGKTTLLRLIAGFERPDSGRIELGGSDVTRVPPYARDVNTVFQDYALFPHMTVAQNIEYGLRVRHVPKAQRRERVSKALDMVRLPGLGSRKPTQLSGGQRQRVALARAIVNEPQVLLLDEPLGALDLKLRQEMQLELLRVQREVGITFVYVTHDQEEALTMSDRIAVLNHGSIEQIGGPIEVYEQPHTAFVAGFIGVSNLIERDGHRITVRPEKITLLEDGQQDPPSTHVESGRVQDVIYAGVLTRYVVDLDGGGELVVSRQNVEAPVLRHDAREGGAPIARGDRVRIAWRTEQAFTIPQEPGQGSNSGEGLPMMTTCARISPRMKIALGLAVASLVAVGCSSSSGNSSSSSNSNNSQGTGTGTAGLTVPTANLPVLQKIGKGEGQLNLIAWEGYLQPLWVKPFEQQTGCQINAKYAGSSDEMVALMKNGGGGQYDMVSSSGDADLRILYAGDAHPVNINLIPSWKEFFPAFQSPPFNTINGVHYGVSLQWGPNVLMYNTKDFPTAPTSWSIIYNPKYKGQVTVPDNPIQIADAALYLKTHNPSLGITDPYELTQPQFQASVNLLAGQRPLIEKYWDLASQEIFDFKNGNAIIGAGWPYQVSTLKADHFPIGSVVPGEGATGWADTWMLAAKAPHPNCAYMWMQYISTPKVQAEQAINYGETPDNSLACGYMDQMQPGSCAEYHANAPLSYLSSISLWKTPIATCDNAKPDCVPYSEWVSAWNTQIK